MILTTPLIIIRTIHGTVTTAVHTITEIEPADNPRSTPESFRARHKNQLFVHDHLRRPFAHLKVGAHFLNLRGLFLEVGCEDLHPFLLLRDC
jgi:hypothetical protein